MNIIQENGSSLLLPFALGATRKSVVGSDSEMCRDPLLFYTYHQIFLLYRKSGRNADFLLRIRSIAEKRSMVFSSVKMFDMMICLLSGNDRPVFDSLDWNVIMEERAGNSAHSVMVLDPQIFSDPEVIPVRLQRLTAAVSVLRNESVIKEQRLFIIGEDYKQSTMIGTAEITSFVQLFEHGSFAEIEEKLDLLAEQTRNSNTVTSYSNGPTSIKRMYMELFSFISHAAYDYGVDVDQVLDYSDPYTTIFSFADTPLLKEWFLSVCRRLYSECNASSQKGKKGLVMQIENSIKANHSKPFFSVTDIAEQLGMSATYLSHTYKTCAGTTIVQAINNERMKTASDLLMKTALPIKDICVSSGFANMTYFYSSFKKKFGMPPAEYRTKIKTQKQK